MTKPNSSQQARFKYLSELAARQERQGNYQQATKTWADTARSATKIRNQQWCLNRSEFCERMAFRPFSKGENNEQ